jgi:DNA polymerase III sliding clamp (beta) subunit (PCNA family)
MHATVSTRVLIQLLKAALPAVARASHHAALKCVKLTAHAAGVTLAATNNELSIAATAADGPPPRPGACLIDAERLKAILAALPDGDLTVSVQADKVKLAAARCKYDLTAIPLDEFPDPANEGEKAVSCARPPCAACSSGRRSPSRGARTRRPAACTGWP